MYPMKPNAALGTHACARAAHVAARACASARAYA